MIKQSKTTIKELSAQYRSVLKRAFLAGIAVVTVVSNARAEITMADVVASANETQTTPADEAPNPASDTTGRYEYTDRLGNTVNGSSVSDTFDTKAANTSYIVTSTAGTGASADIVSYNGTGLSAATELVGETGAETINYSNYQYKDGQGNMVGLGTQAKTFTRDVDLYDYTKVSGDKVTVTGGAPGATVAYDKFAFTYAGTTYTLKNDTTVNDGTSDIIINDMDNGTVKELSSALATAHADAQTAVNNAQTELNGYATTEATNYALATGVVATDTANVQNAKTNYAGYETAYDTYQTDLSAYENWTDYKPYKESLAKAIDDRTNAEITKAIADGGAIDTAISAIDSKIGGVNGLKENLETRDVYHVGAGNNLSSGTSSTVEDHLVALDSAIGKRSALSYGNVTSDSDVSTNLLALDTAIGDTTLLNDASGNHNTSGGVGTADGTTVSGAIANLDASIGQINGLQAKLQSVNSDAGTNLASGTTVEEHLTALDASIGDKTALSGNNVDSSASVAINLQSLNDGIESETTRAMGIESGLQTAIDNIGATNANAIIGLDKRVNDLDKDLSAGIAGVAALSSVEVSNVKRGEVSVGGGYGYYNGESAMAVGAAMGLTDNWSINAGAGFSNADTAFRAGTNYKFKLF